MQEMELALNEMRAANAKLAAQVAAQQTARSGKLTIKHSVFTLPSTENPKGLKGGTVGIYGLNSRFPVTLHPDQWLTLADTMPAVLQYIRDNADAIVAGRSPLADGEISKGSDANGLRVGASQRLAKLDNPNKIVVVPPVK